MSLFYYNQNTRLKKKKYDLLYLIRITDPGINRIRIIPERVCSGNCEILRGYTAFSLQEALSQARMVFKKND